MFRKVRTFTLQCTIHKNSSGGNKTKIIFGWGIDRLEELVEEDGVGTPSEKLAASSVDFLASGVELEYHTQRLCLLMKTVSNSRINNEILPC